MDETYHYLNMDYRADLPAAYSIWKHDNELLQKALHFYQVLEEKLGETDWVKLSTLLEADKAPKGFDKEAWAQAKAAHLGYQTGRFI